jgi:hypothetical protein
MMKSRDLSNDKVRIGEVGADRDQKKKNGLQIC